MEWVQAARKRYEKTKRPTRSDQQVFIEWLLDNPNVEFTVEGLAKELDIESSKISAHIRNTKRWFGFVYSVKKFSERCNPYRIYAFTGYKEESNTQILNNVFR
jgi:predicted transcriptional regulator